MDDFLGQAAEFYLGFYQHSHLQFYPSIVLMTTEKHNVSYSIEAPGIGYYGSGIITADDEVVLHLPDDVVVSYFDDYNKGIYIRTSSRKVTVYGQAFVEGYSRTQGYYWPYTEHLEAFVAIPVIDLCSREYYYYAVSSSGYSLYYNSSVLVVGTEDNTVIKLTGAKSVTVSVGYYPTHLIPGKEYSFKINRLQTMYIGSPDDLTGSKIVADKQVSVFSGHQHGNITNTLSDNMYSRSYLVEQIPPTVLWGKVHYVTPLSKLVSASYVIKVVASKQCVIKIYCNSSSLPTFTTALYEGQFVNKTFSNNETCTVLSTAEVLVAQFSFGVHSSNGLMMTLVPSREQYYNDFILSTINGSAGHHYINVIVTAEYYQPSMIYITTAEYNRSLETQQWVPIKVNNIIEAYATQVNITYGTSKVFHINDAAMMMIIVYGLSSYGSYGAAISNNINKGTVTLNIHMHRYLHI